jgi:hypothetical protein
VICFSKLLVTTYKTTHRTNKSKTHGKDQSAVFIFATWGISPPPFSSKEVPVLLGYLSCQDVLTLDHMMALLCTAILLCPLLYSIVSFPTMKNFVQHVSIPSSIQVT